MKLNFILKRTTIETQQLEKGSLLTKSTLMFTDSILLLSMEEEVDQMMVKVLLCAELSPNLLKVMRATGTY